MSFGWGAVAEKIGDFVSDVGSQWVTNEIVSKPNSAVAFKQTKELQDRQQKYNTLNATTAWERSQKAAVDSFNRELWGYANRYKMTSRDMKNAGLNPILAASSGFSVSGAPSSDMANAPAAQVSMGQGYQPDYPQSGSSALRFSQAAESQAGASLKESERSLNLVRIGLIKEETEVAKQQSLSIIQETALKRAQIGVAQATEKKTIQEINNLTVDLEKKAYEMWEINGKVQLMMKQSDLAQTEREYYEKLTKKVNQEYKNLSITADKLEAELVKIDKVSDVYSGRVGTILAWIQELLNTINPLKINIKNVNVGE